MRCHRTIQKQTIVHISQTPNIFDIFTHLTEDEKIQLFTLSQGIAFSQPTVVEIGSYLGASTCFLAAGIRKRHGNVYAVDTWDNQAMSEGKRDTYAEFLHNIEPLKNYIIPLRGTSTEIAKTFSHKIDLLFIDGDHSYEACLNDWQAWSLFLNKNAIIVFHDVGWADGVQRVIKENVSPGVRKEEQLPNLYWAWL